MFNSYIASVSIVDEGTRPISLQTKPSTVLDTDVFDECDVLSAIQKL